MAVYTVVSFEEASELLRQLKLGELTALTGCTGGIENTNYFVTAEHNAQIHEYVLTLFERLTMDQLQFYLRLMKHLAQAGIPVPNPSPNAQGQLAFEICGKPAVVVNRLPGKHALDPTPAHCAQVGAMLAKMHLAGRDFELSQPNLRGLTWCNDTVPKVLPYLSNSQQALLQHELDYQKQVAGRATFATLPRGAVHADLFRDNAMFDTLDGEPILSGIFDFYFAGIDTWIFDLAICLNDWCIDLATGMPKAQNTHHFIASYNAVRPLHDAERDLLPAMLRCGALRFWLSRLWDMHLPREASLLQAHDPEHFERVLLARSTHPLTFDELAELT
jgi:homoserine kinase type II